MTETEYNIMLFCVIYSKILTSKKNSLYFLTYYNLSDIKYPIHDLKLSNISWTNTK